MLLDDSSQSDDDDTSEGHYDTPPDFEALNARGNRGPQRKRRICWPYESMFWTKYIVPATQADPNDTESIWNKDSYEGSTFRRCFSNPYVMFDDICTAWSTFGEYQKEKNMYQRKQIDARLLILGCYWVI